MSLRNTLECLSKRLTNIELQFQLAKEGMSAFIVKIRETILEQSSTMTMTKRKVSVHYSVLRIVTGITSPNVSLRGVSDEAIAWQGSAIASQSLAMTRSGK